MAVSSGFGLWFTYFWGPGRGLCRGMWCLGFGDLGFKVSGFRV